MKILLAASKMNHGGAESHLYELASALFFASHDITLVSEGGSTANRLRAIGIKTVYAPLSKKDPISLWRSLNVINNLCMRNNFDLVHAHTRLSAFVCAQVAKHFDFTFVTTAHALFSASGAKKLASFWGERTIAVSDDIKARLVKSFGVPGKRITVIKNGINQKSFSPLPESALGSVGTAAVSPLRKRKSKEKRIVFVSRMDKDSSLVAELLTELAPRLKARFPDLTVTLIGGGDRLRKIRKKASGINKEIGKKAVFVLGAKDNLENILPRFDLFVGVSRAALEAIFCGLPIILAGNEGYLGPLTSENLSDAKSSNFCCRAHALPNKERLYKDICLMLEEKAQGTVTANDVADEYSTEAMLGATLDFYRSALAGHKDFLKHKLEVKHKSEAKHKLTGKRELEVKHKQKAERQQTVKRKSIVERKLAVKRKPSVADKSNVARRQTSKSGTNEIAAVPSPSNRRGILFNGYYGFGNMGDDQTLLQLTNKLRSRYPSLPLSVLSAKCRRSEKDGKAKRIFRYSFKSIAREMKHSSVCAIAGGTVLQDKSSLRSMLYYVLIMKIAKQFGCKAALVSNGLGPFKRKITRALAKSILLSADYISLRDTDSLALAKEICEDRKSPRKITVPLLSNTCAGQQNSMNLPKKPCIRAKNLFSSADLAFLTEFVPDSEHVSDSSDLPNQKLAPKHVSSTSTLSTDTKNRYIAVSVRPLSRKHAKEAEKALITALRMLKAKHGLIPLYVLMHPSKDLAPTLRLQKACGGNIFSPNTAEDCIAILRRAEVSLGMRLHFLIYSALASSLPLPIIYDGKVSALVRELRLPRAIPLSSLSAENIISSVLALISDRKNLLCTLKNRVEEKKRAATADLERFLMAFEKQLS